MPMPRVEENGFGARTLVHADGTRVPVTRDFGIPVGEPLCSERAHRYAYEWFCRHVTGLPPDPTLFGGPTGPTQ